MKNLNGKAKFRVYQSLLNPHDESSKYGRERPYVRKILCGELDETSPPMAEIWSFLDSDIQAELKEILFALYDINLEFCFEDETIALLEKHAKRMATLKK